jgi:hypothetical protein
MMTTTNTARPADLPAFCVLLAPRTEEEAEMAMRIAMASRHIWAFRLKLTIEERMAWYRAFPDPMHVTAPERYTASGQGRGSR